MRRRRTRVFPRPARIPAATARCLRIPAPHAKMGKKDAILELRKGPGLSQEEFTEALLVTRQAVSRWETGATMPAVDTLTRMAQTYHVSADQLLGRPAALCQCCGMTLERDSDRGTEADGGKSEEYCAFCFQHGAFAQDISMDGMIELDLRDLDEWNRAEGLHLSVREAGEQLREFLPTLKRWRKPPAPKEPNL